MLKRAKYSSKSSKVLGGYVIMNMNLEPESDHVGQSITTCYFRTCCIYFIHVLFPFSFFLFSFFLLPVIFFFLSSFSFSTRLDYDDDDDRVNNDLSFLRSTLTIHSLCSQLD